MDYLETWTRLSKDWVSVESMLICDTSGLLAYFDSGEPDHLRVSEAISNDSGPIVVSAQIITELDYIVATRRGIVAEVEVLDELAGGAWNLECLDPVELGGDGM